MERKNSSAKIVIKTAMAFVGFNVGSGFATGMEGMQFFAAFGVSGAIISLVTATIVLAAGTIPVYIFGYEQQFKSGGDVYGYISGNKQIARLFDGYIYINVLLAFFVMLAGAGATFEQYYGISVTEGMSIMAAVCIVTAMLKLEQMQNVLSYLSIVLIAFVVISTIVVAISSDVGMIEGAKNVDRYAESGEVLRATFLGLENPVCGGIGAGALMLTGSMPWSCVSGQLCKSRKQAVLGGVFSCIGYYVLMALSVYVMLVCMDLCAGSEVPLLAVISEYMPMVSGIFSIIILLGLYSTVSGRLFLICSRFDRGRLSLRIIIAVAVSVVAVVGGMFISFSRLTNIVFIISGSIGVVLCIMILAKYVRNRRTS